MEFDCAPVVISDLNVVGFSSPFGLRSLVVSPFSLPLSLFSLSLTDSLAVEL